MSEVPQRHLFVVGFARSGTSLLYSFLNLHPKIKLLYEPDLLSHSLVAVSAATGQKWWERLDFFNSTCRRHRLAPQPSWKNIRSAKDAATALYTQYGGGEPLYIGEKSPSYYNCLPDLARQFPDAKIIVIWREPRSMISSIVAAGKKHYFFSNSSFPIRAIMGFEQMQRDVLSLRAQGFPVFDLCYEDLAEKPDVLLKAICEFLELPFDPRMLELDLADTSMFPPGEHHAKVKSGQVVPSDRSNEVLENSIQQKIPRYLSRWKTLFRDQLASRRYWPQTKTEEPGLLEVAFDRVRYRLALFTSEQFTPFVYGFFPMSLLRLYRTWRGKTFAPSSSGNLGATGAPAIHPLKISVITPSYKQLPWLKLCAASVADQKGVVVEHIIQDAQSGSDLEEWARTQTNAQVYIEYDSGMYDAINRGFARATGDIVCWLNSDEQYLEGSLAKVAHFFEEHPEVDVLFGDALLVGNTGDLISYRRTVEPTLAHIHASHLNVLSCATFLRRSVLDQGFKLNTRWKTIADAVWVADLLQAGVPIAVINEPLAVFTITDKNLGQTSLAASETRQWQKETSPKSRWMSPFVVIWHRLTKLARGAYWPRSASTHLYTLASPGKRVLKEASYIGFHWPK